MTPTGGRPLARFSVLNLTTARSGPTCTKILADLGADVPRVERPGGQGRERVFFDAADLRRTKRSVAVNLQDPRGVAIVKRLASLSREATLEARRAEGVIEQHKGETT